MKTISMFVAAAALCPSAAVRPERSGLKTITGLAKIGDLVEPAQAIATSTSPMESLAALKLASGIVDSILLQVGNATEHMTGDEKTLLQKVISLMKTVIYKSMDEGHTADESSLASAIVDIEQCSADITNRLSATGDLGMLQHSVRTKQKELNSLQVEVDEKTVSNVSAWKAFSLHMDLISNPPDVPGFPRRTMPALDVYFDGSDYCLWFSTQQAAYFTKRDFFLAASEALEQAIAAHRLGRTKRDVQYCDWKPELIEGCASFDECYLTKSNFYSKELEPRVKIDVDKRIEIYRAGETLIQQVKFLLADSGTRETPTVQTERYEIDSPTVPAKGACDLSVLSSAEWKPTVSCQALKNPRCSCTTPNAGKVGNNQYTCDDGYSAWCASDEVCYATTPFTKGQVGDGCKKPPVMCSCQTPNAGTAHKNKYTCSDGHLGSKGHSGSCASNELCYATSPFRKGEWADGCKKEVTCSCSTPNAGSIGKNQYQCTDGTSAWCASNEICYASSPFRKGQWSEGCKKEPTCSCSTPNAGSIGKNQYQCTDGSSSWCAHNEMCSATSPFKKGRWADGCKQVMCSCVTPGRGTANHNQYRCTDGTSSWCSHHDECYARSPFQKGRWGDGCRHVPWHARWFR